MGLKSCIVNRIEKALHQYTWLENPYFDATDNK